MQVMNQMPVMRPKLAASVSVAKAPQQQSDAQQNDGLRFSGSGNKRTFLGFFGRVWNGFVEWLHGTKDAAERDNPIPRLNAERNRIVAENSELEKSLAGFEGRYMVAANELKELEAKWQIEEEEANASAVEYQDCMTKLGEDHAETKAALTLANKEANEAEAAKKTYEAKKAAVGEMELAALDARQTRESNQQTLVELVAAIEQAAQDFKDAQALEQVKEMKDQLETAKGQRVGQSNDVGELIRSIKERKATAQVLVGNGKSIEERKAELAVQTRVKTAQAGTSLKQRLAKLNQTEAPKAEAAGSAGQSTTTPPTQGNPFDNQGKK